MTDRPGQLSLFGGELTPASGTADAMVARFLRAFDPGLRAAAEAAHLSVREAVTLALYHVFSHST